MSVTTAMVPRGRMWQERSLPQLTAEIIDDVADDVAESIEALLDGFMPDGTPFGQKKLSERDQLKQYLGQLPESENLHGDVQACGKWMQTKVDQLVELLTTFGATPEQIAAVHPWDVVITAGLRMSALRERALEREAGKARGEG